MTARVLLALSLCTAGGLAAAAALSPCPGDVPLFVNLWCRAFFGVGAAFFFRMATERRLYE